MEKYYRVTEESKLYKDTMDYKEMTTKVNDYVKEFFEEKGIETTEYSCGKNDLYIVPTKKDIEKFEKVLCKPRYENGLRSFRRNSKISKDWAMGLDDRGLKSPLEPMLQFYFEGIWGSISYRLFDVNEIVYCSIKTDVSEIKTPKGMVEMKASEFFKIIEDYEEND